VDVDVDVDENDLDLDLVGWTARFIQMGIIHHCY